MFLSNDDLSVKSVHIFNSESLTVLAFNVNSILLLHSLTCTCTCLIKFVYFY